MSKKANRILSLLLCSFLIGGCFGDSETPSNNESARSPLMLNESAGSSQASSEAPKTTIDTPLEYGHELTVFTEINSNSEKTIENTLIYKYAEGYMALHPDIKINFEYKKSYGDDESQKELEEKLFELLRTQDNQPDVILLPSRTSHQRLAQKTKLADIGALLDTDTDITRSDFFENILSAYDTGGTLHFLPLEFNMPSFTINKTFAPLLSEDVESLRQLNYKQMLDLYPAAQRASTENNTVYLTNLYDLHIENRLHWVDIDMFTYMLDFSSIDHTSRYADINTSDNLNAFAKWAEIPPMPGGGIVSSSPSATIDISAIMAKRQIDPFFDPNPNAVFWGGYTVSDFIRVFGLILLTHHLPLRL